MTREFIITKEFDRSWKELGLNDDDLGELEIFLCKNPDCGDTLEGTGGVKKFRWALEGRGKSGGARVIIRVRIVNDELQLLYIYDKADFDNITDSFLKDVMQRMEYDV